MSIGSRTLKLLGREISKQLKSLFQKQSVISDKNSATSNKKRRIGFRQLLRRVGIITSQS
jgi:ribosomal protein L21